MRVPQPYEELDHTADVGVRVYGDTAEDVLARLVCVLGQLLAGSCDERDAEEMVHFEVEGGDPALAAIDVLRELLYRFSTERLVPVECEIEAFDEDRVMAAVGLARYDPDREPRARGTDIKAVTYHAAELCPIATGWCAQVVFDV